MYTMHVELNADEPITVFPSPAGNALVFLNLDKGLYRPPIPNEPMKNFLSFEIAAGYNGNSSWKDAAKDWITNNFGIDERDILFMRA